MQGDPSLRLKYGSAQDDAAGKGQRDLSLPLKNSADLDDAAGKGLGLLPVELHGLVVFVEGKLQRFVCACGEVGGDGL